MLVLCLCACQTVKDDPSTLLYALTSTNDVAAVECVDVIHDNSVDKTTLTDPDSWTFLRDYTYCRDYPSDRLSELLAIPSENPLLYITVNGQVRTTYLLPSGELVLVSADGPFKVFAADSDRALTDEQIAAWIE